MIVNSVFHVRYWKTSFKRQFFIYFIYLLALQSYKSAIKYITMIEGMVNRIWVPCENQPDAKQQVDIH
jgi:hypothetical protein